MEDNQEGLLKAAQVAAILNVPEYSTRHLMRTGTIPTVRVGARRVRVRAQALQLICPPKTRPSPVLEFGRVKTRKGRAQWPHQRG